MRTTSKLIIAGLVATGCVQYQANAAQAAQTDKPAVKTYCYYGNRYDSKAYRTGFVIPSAGAACAKRAS